jgi:choline-sulfatase
VQLDYDEETHFRALEYLRERARRAARNPFFLCVSYSHPHSPYFAPRRYWDLYERADLPLPVVPSLPEESRPVMDRWLNEFHGCSHVDFQTPGNIRRTRQGYAGLVTYIDDKLGDLLRTLETLKLRDNTVIIFLSDHGDMLCERGMVDKRNFYEWSVRIPLIIHWPGRIAGGRTCAEPVDLIDLFPTLLDMAGCPAANVDGDSLWPWLTAQSDAAGDGAAFSEYHGEGVPAPCAMVRQGPWKYIETWHETPQLYNLAEDPHERRNISGTSAVSGIEQACGAMLHQRFDFAAIDAAVRDCQQRRLLIRRAMWAEPRTFWNYRPLFDVDHRFVR